MLTHPTVFFSEDYNSAIRGAGPSNFYTPYNSLKCISSRTWGTGRPHVGLCPIFLVWIVSVVLMFVIHRWVLYRTGLHGFTVCWEKTKSINTPVQQTEAIQTRNMGQKIQMSGHRPLKRSRRLDLCWRSQVHPSCLIATCATVQNSAIIVRGW